MAWGYSSGVEREGKRKVKSEVKVREEKRYMSRY